MVYNFLSQIRLTRGKTLIYHDLKLPIIVRQQQGFPPFVDDTLKININLWGVAWRNRNREQQLHSKCYYFSSNRFHAHIVSNF